MKALFFGVSFGILFILVAPLYATTTIRNTVPATSYVRNQPQNATLGAGTLLGSLGGDSSKSLSVSDSDLPLYIYSKVWCLPTFSDVYVYTLIEDSGTYTISWDLKCGGQGPQPHLHAAKW